ncbi:hypothetical protein D3C71_1496670 [compost metagenome]
MPDTGRPLASTTWTPCARARAMACMTRGVSVWDGSSRVPSISMATSSMGPERWCISMVFDGVERGGIQSSGSTGHGGGDCLPHGAASADGSGAPCAAIVLGMLQTPETTA